MGKKGFSIQHALLMYNADDQCVDGTSTPRNLDGARQLAQSVLQMSSGVAYVLIHVYDNLGNMAQQPIKRVDWDQEW